MTVRGPYRLVGALLALLALGGCQLPHPFAHEGPEFKNALLDLPTGDGVRVVVVDGLAPEIADPLRQAAVKALGDAGIPATSEPTLASGYVLTGVVQVDDFEDGKPEAARFVWQLTGRDGLALGAFDKEVSGTHSGWLGSDPALLDLVAQDASVQVAALLRDRRGGPATVDGITEAAVPAEEATLYLKGVTGAPGDGNDSLARAMASVLKRSGVPLAAPDKATHVLTAVVTAEPREPGVSIVNIDWVISDRTGAEIGKISQRNPVKTALIEGRWGELAHVVAGAAGDGILDTFGGAGDVPATGHRLALPK